MGIQIQQTKIYILSVARDILIEMVGNFIASVAILSPVIYQVDTLNKLLVLYE